MPVTLPQIISEKNELFFCNLQEDGVYLTKLIEIIHHHEEGLHQFHFQVKGVIQLPFFDQHQEMLISDVYQKNDIIISDGTNISRAVIPLKINYEDSVLQCFDRLMEKVNQKIEEEINSSKVIPIDLLYKRDRLRDSVLQSLYNTMER